MNIMGLDNECVRRFEELTWRRIAEKFGMPTAWFVSGAANLQQVRHIPANSIDLCGILGLLHLVKLRF